MSKILHIVMREFIATVATKGFILGIVITPLIILISIVGFSYALNREAPAVKGEVAVIDATGQVFEGMHAYLQPRAIAERREDFRKLVQEAVPESVTKIAGTRAGGDSTELALKILGQVPQFDVIRLDRSTDLEQAKEPLRSENAETSGRLAVVVIHDDAVVRPAGKDKFGKYDLYVKEQLKDRVEDEIQRAVRRSIIDARVKAAGLDRDEIDALTNLDGVRSTTVTEEGERETNEEFNALLPMGFMLLLFVSVITGGQHLMTSTIEEKSSRVVEVLLSAVSPMQLMTGKIVGQMLVGFLIMAVYAGMGFSALVAFAVAGLLKAHLLVYLVIFYLIAYFVVASMMAAIGAAVNEIREAQTFMMPVMMTMMIPWILWFPISDNPNSAFAVATSFIPPLNSFVMLLRVTSTTPPPTWQIWLSILVGIASAFAAVWFAAKVFRVGLLMYGKPPDFRTLIRWARMA